MRRTRDAGDLCLTRLLKAKPTFPRLSSFASTGNFNPGGEMKAERRQTAAGGVNPVGSSRVLWLDPRASSLSGRANVIRARPSKFLWDAVRRRLLNPKQIYRGGREIVAPNQAFSSRA